MKNVKDICFLFGAGAEAEYKLPLGEQFTLETILKKRVDMYEELKVFYANRMVSDYIQTYRKDFLFTKSSNAFYEMIYRALKQCKEDFSKNNIDKGTQGFLKFYYGSHAPEADTKKEFKENVVEIMYDYIINNVSARPDRKHYKYKSMFERMTYYGTIEKDFSSVIDPNGAGLIQFWRFVNYLWSAFFSITLPLLDNSDLFTNEIYYDQYKANKYQAKYQAVLQNLNDVVSFLYSDKYLNSVKSVGYYSKLQKKFADRINCALTTNYTPFVKNIFNKTAYLAGELSSFEYPHQLEVKDITKSSLNAKSFVFPFLLTQAPVKPIIEPKQIKEYSKMYSSLNNSRYLVVLGYNINSNDNHINAYIREFVKRTKTHLIFCKFVSNISIVDNSEDIYDICHKLYLKHTRKNIHILYTDGNTDKLCNDLEKLIDNLSNNKTPSDISERVVII